MSTTQEFRDAIEASLKSVQAAKEAESKAAAKPK